MPLSVLWAPGGVDGVTPPAATDCALVSWPAARPLMLVLKAVVAVGCATTLYFFVKRA